VSVVVIGLNHRTASLDLLERMTVDGTRLPKALHDLAGRAHLSEAVVLSTCNRTEVYAVAEKFHGGFQDVRDFLAELAFLAPEDFADHLYVHHDDQAVGHLFEVAAGLDSAVIGETEILGQVGEAWDVARVEGTAGSTLNLLFRHALEIGKKVRTDTGIARGITSLSQAAVALAAEQLGSLAGAAVLVVGAGDMGEGMAVALQAAGAGEVLVANRSAAPAEALAARVGGRAIDLFELTGHLGSVDVVLTSTGAQALILEHADVSRAMAERAGRPLLIIDIAVPRDVDPAAAEIPGLTLLDMDDLRRFADAGAAGRRREAAAARLLVEAAVSRYAGDTSAREAAPLVTALRDRAENVRAAELDRVAGRLAELDDRQREAVEAATRAIVAKLLHEPTVRLKDASGTSRGDRLAESLRDLFDL
jgi:glutamyl-tRNA reductase